MAYIYDIMMDTSERKYTIGVDYTLNEIESEIVKENNLNIIFYNAFDEMVSAYDRGDIVAYITKREDKYIVYNNDKSDVGSYVQMYITSYLEGYNSYLGHMYLAQNDIDSNLVYSNISYDLVRLPGNSMLAGQVINMAIVFTIMGITLTAVYAATDLTAGEKERGTLETLLTYPIKSSELIIGKFLAIVISTIITLVISIIFALASLWYVKNNFMSLKDIALNINVLSVLLMFVILTTYSLFISGLCIAIASFAKSFKEAQSTLTPVSLIVCAPMLMELIDVRFGGYLAFIPIFNHTFVLNDIFAGNIDIFNIVSVIVSSILYASILIFVIVKQYQSEKILFG